MDSILFLIAQFLTPHALGLDVVPFAGDCREYVFDHPVGQFFLKLEGGRLTIDLAFRMSNVHIAGSYLDTVVKALAAPIPLDEKTQLEFTFEKNHFIGFVEPPKDAPAGQRGINYHAATFLFKEADTTPVPLELKPAAVE